MEYEPKDESKEPDKAFIEGALDRFKVADEDFSEIREAAIEDLKFSLGDQWPSSVKSSRESDERPCLTLNRMTPFVRHVSGQQKKQRQAISINPTGDTTTKESADILQGIIRNIEYRSESQEAINHAYESMLRSSLGYWRIRNVYLPGDSIDQELKIEEIEDISNVLFDPFCKKKDKSDARFCFIFEDMPKESFRLEYGERASATLSVRDFGNLGPSRVGWLSNDTVRIAEYYYIEETKVVIYEFSDGSTQPKDSVEDLEEYLSERGIQKVDEHTKIKRNLKWAKLTGIEVLEQSDIAGDYIPVVCVAGDNWLVDGKRMISSMVRDAKDPQRTYNYAISAAVEAVALSPRAPYMGLEGTFDGHEREWAEINRRSMAYVQFKAAQLPDGSYTFAPPTRNAYEPPIQAIMALAVQSDNDMKAIMNIYDASLGERGPEQSGKAIIARQTQSDLGNVNFSENLALAIRHTGRILVDLIPKIYTTTRVAKIINPDESVDAVVLYNGEQNKEEAERLKGERDIDKLLDVSRGEYSVTVSVGQSFQTKRQEAQQMLLEFMQVYPQAAPIIGDLVAGNMDWDHADELARRLRILLPPQLQSEEMKKDPEVVVGLLQNQLQQITEQYKQLEAAFKQAAQTIQSKKMELESREKIEAMKQQVELIKAESDIKGKLDLEVVKATLQEIRDMRQQFDEMMQGAGNREGEYVESAQGEGNV